MSKLEKVGPGRWTYRGYTITDDGYARPYAYVSDDYDGPGDHRCGEAKTLEETIEDIDEIIIEEEEAYETEAAAEDKAECEDDRYGDSYGERWAR